VEIDIFVLFLQAKKNKIEKLVLSPKVDVEPH